MKKALLILAIVLVPLFAQNTDWYTKNTNVATFEISTAEELRGLAQLVNNGNSFVDKTIKLTNDIALSGIFIPIGDYGKQFQGTFDGQSYTISGLCQAAWCGDLYWENRVYTYVGLFGYVGTSGQIKNINVIVREIVAPFSARDSYAGGLVGYYASTKLIENSSVQGDSVIASRDNSFAGGLVGYANSALIANSYAKVNIRTSTSSSDRSVSYSGGLIGGAGSITIVNSYASGNVFASYHPAYGPPTSYSGGLVGYAYSAITIANSYASGNISRRSSYSSYSGGLIGFMDAKSTSNIINSYASGISDGGIFGGAAYESETNSSVYYNSEGAKWAVGGAHYATGIMHQELTGILGLSDADLKKQASFIGWDFDNIWDITEDVAYPFLKEFSPSNFEVEYVHDQTYSRTQIKPEPIVRSKTGTKPILIKGTDYDFSYGENTIVGTGTIKITGKGNYSALQGYRTFNIIPKPLTITGATVTSKIYDGTTAATITGETLHGVCEGDDVSFSLTGAFHSADAGENKVVYINITLAGAATSNYSIPPSSLYDLRPPIDGVITPSTYLIGTVIAKQLPENSIQTISDQPYSGSNLTPVITVKDGENIIANTNYDVSYNNNKNAGTATVTITAKHNYSGTATTTFAINAKSLTNAMIQPISEQTYSCGDEIKPAVTVRDGLVLVENEDYTLAYTNNIVSGTATATIIGRGNYTGTVNRDFYINKKVLTVSGATVVSKTYDGTTTATIIGATLQDVCENDNGKVSLTNHLTGTFSYEGVSSNMYVNTNMALSGSAADNYSLTKPSLTGIITAKQLAENAIQTISDQPYTGSNRIPAITVKDGENIITNTNYDVSYSNNRNAGIATVTITGKGNYSGTATATFIINAKDLTSAMIQPIPAQIYLCGDGIEPVITVIDNRVLAKEVDYSITYADNSGYGTATATITGIGNYTSTASRTFFIDKKVLTVSGAIATSKTYDGTTATTITGATLQGVCENDDVSLENLTGAFVNANVGEGKTVYTYITLTGTAENNYSLTQPTLTGTIIAKTLTGNMIEAIPDQTNTDNAITPVPIIKDGNYTLILNQDFVIDEYQNNTDLGNATVIISGIDTYSGTHQITFKIVAGQIVNEPTPTLLTQMTTGNIHAYAIGNTIVLQNLPKGKNVQIYNLKGELISSKNFNQVNQGSDMSVEVQTKGMYIVKVNHETLRIAVK